MKPTRSIAAFAALLALGLGGERAFAQAQTYDNSVRLGLYIIKYNVKADDISGPFVPPGASVDVKDTNTLYLAYVRRLNKDFDLEFAFGNPPKTETVGKGPATLGSAPYDGQVLATAKWFSPSVLLQYKFLEESSAWRPYVGFGFNYTHFYDIQSTDAGNAVTGGPTKTTLTNSFTWAANLGISYRINGPWHAYASYNYAPVKSKATLETAGVTRSTTIHFNPSAYVFSVGYSF
jgi:outer membrane protein